MIAEPVLSPLDSAAARPFEHRAAAEGVGPIQARQPAVLQLNLGYRCNQQCVHCHIEAGPSRVEEMPEEVMAACLGFAERAGIREFDLTGGAPEMHPRFRWLVEAIRRRGGAVTDRCNLTVLCEAGQEDMADFLAAHQVRVMASLPCYTLGATDRARGSGVFGRSLAGLRALNAAGYGQPESGLELVLVHNPSGPALPGCQQGLEADYRARLQKEHEVVLTRLIAMTNVPAGRLLHSLVRSRSLVGYMALLEQQFNPATLPKLMCLTTLSVGWDGTLYDCDFNQSLGIPAGNGTVMRVQDAAVEVLARRSIRCGNHCYACAAGPGSSCGGAIAG